MKKTFLALSLVSAFALAGCTASAPTPTQDPSGFLPDYSLLKQVKPSPSGMQIYTYNAPRVKRSDYHAVIVNPVQLYQTVTANGITAPEIANAQVEMQNGIKTIVSKQMPLTTIPGNGVAVMDIAITGAEVNQEGMQPQNVMPISAAIKLASVATGLNSKIPVMVVEMKFTDSVSGRLLRETMTVISGDGFRTATNASEFTALAQTWVQEALQYSSKNQANNQN